MDNFCRYCGKRLEEGENHDCPKMPVTRVARKAGSFFKDLMWKTGFGDSKSGEQDYYEREKQIAPDSICINDGEVPIKQYDIAVLRSRLKLTRAEGRMQVTNKRLLFRSTGISPRGKITYQQEFALDKIDGVEIRQDYRFMAFDMILALLVSSIFVALGAFIGKWFVVSPGVFLGILAILLTALTCVPFFTMYRKFFLKLIISAFGNGLISIAISNEIFVNGFLDTVGYIVGIVSTLISFVSLFFCCFQPNLTIEVKTSGGTPGMQIKHKYTSFLVWRRMEEYSGFSEILPSKDSNEAIKEIGALINDIKTLGDIGVEKWKK